MIRAFLYPSTAVFGVSDTNELEGMCWFKVRRMSGTVGTSIMQKVSVAE